MNIKYINRINLKRLFVFFLFPILFGFVRGETKSLTMESAVQSALKLNERVAIAGERINVSEAYVLKARSFFLPTITTTGTYTRRPNEVQRTIGEQTVTIQSLNALSGSLNLNTTLLDFRAFPLYRQVKLEAKSERYNSMESKRSLSFEVCSAFLTTLSVDQLLKAAQQRYELAGKNFEASEARYDAQLVSVNDVTRSRLEYTAAESNITRAQGDVDTARLQLEFLIGIPIEGELITPGQLLSEAEALQSSAGQLILDAQKRRPDLHALRWHAKAQHAAALEPVLRWLPNLGLSGSYKITNESGLTGKKTNWSVSLDLNWTLFDGFTRIGDFKEQKALAAIADLDLQTNIRQVDMQVRSALVTLTSQQASLKQTAVALDVAKKNAAETAELYRQGLTGALEAADANLRLYEAEVELIRARYGLAIAFLNLRMALGLDPFGNTPGKI